MSGYNDNIGDIDEPDDAWSNLPASFGLELERRRQAQAILAQQSDNPKDSQSESVVVKSRRVRAVRVLTNLKSPIC